MSIFHLSCRCWAFVPDYPGTWIPASRLWGNWWAAAAKGEVRGKPRSRTCRLREEKWCYHTAFIKYELCAQGRNNGTKKFCDGEKLRLRSRTCRHGKKKWCFYTALIYYEIWDQRCQGGGLIRVGKDLILYNRLNPHPRILRKIPEYQQLQWARNKMHSAVLICFLIH